MYVVQDLGPNGFETAALDINNHGMVAGRFRAGDADAWHAFVQVPPYDQAGILTKLSSHTGPGASSANAVNINGWVAGSFTRNATTRAFVYDSSQDVLRDLQVLLGPLGFKDSSASGINDNGDVIGTGSLGNPNPDFLNSWLWDPTTDSVTNLDAKDGELTGMRAEDLNDSRRIVGAVEPDHEVAFAEVAFAYDFFTNTWVHLPVPEYQKGHAFAVNKAGQVVGSVAGGGAFLFDPGSALIHLGSATTVAKGINFLGQIVGDSFSNTPFLYEGGVAADLNGLISNPDWVLQQASAINDNGQIVGIGLYKGLARGFLLTPPRKPGLPPYNTRPVWPLWNYLTLFGIDPAGGTVIRLPGGTFLSVEPGATPDAVYRAFTTALTDMLSGLAVRQIASQTGNATARREIERAGFDLVEQAARQLVRALDVLKGGSSPMGKE